MAWNGPIGGTDYSNVDFSKPPWVNGIAELTHDEVVWVIETIAPLEEQYLPDENTLISKFNNLTKYEKAINGDTYHCIKGYDPQVNTLGINASGIIQPVEESVTPVEEV